MGSPLSSIGEHLKTEVDLIIERGNRIPALEIKAGRTVNRSFFRGLDLLEEKVTARIEGYEFERYLVYGGDSRHRRRNTQILPWSGVAGKRWA